MPETTRIITCLVGKSLYLNLDLPLLLGGATPKPLVELISGFAGIEILTRKTWGEIAESQGFQQPVPRKHKKKKQFQIVLLVKQPTFFCYKSLETSIQLYLIVYDLMFHDPDAEFLSYKPSKHMRSILFCFFSGCFWGGPVISQHIPVVVFLFGCLGHRLIEQCSTLFLGRLSF